MENLNLQEGEYYLINGSKKILYWDGHKWMKPVKDRQGNLFSYVAHLEKQPKVKSAILFEPKKPW